MKAQSQASGKLFGVKRGARVLRGIAGVCNKKWIPAVSSSGLHNQGLTISYTCLERFINYRPNCGFKFCGVGASEGVVVDETSAAFWPNEFLQALQAIGAILEVHPPKEAAGGLGPGLLGKGLAHNQKNQNSMSNS